MIDETTAYELLKGAICEQAVKDYRAAILRRDRTKQEQLERFFRGQWFLWLVNDEIDGDFVIERVREQCKTSRRSSNRTFPR